MSRCGWIRGVAFSSCAMLALVGTVRWAVAENKPPQQGVPDPDALARTRKQVQMLDGIYKNAIVLVTTHYVDEESDLPAGTAFKKLFEVAKEKGWHEVRLLDATGEPYSDENVAENAFEKRAIQKLVAGEPYVDEVVTVEGKPHLRAATPIPVVMKKCVMCHSNYEDVPAKRPIGALGYLIPIE